MCVHRTEAQNADRGNTAGGSIIPVTSQFFDYQIYRRSVRHGCKLSPSKKYLVVGRGKDPFKTQGKVLAKGSGHCG